MELVLDEVGRIFSWDWAVREVSATIRSGQSVCILGANGSGKSTLLKLIAGVIRPTQGAVTIDRRKVRLGAIRLRQDILMIQPDQGMIGRSIPSHLGAAISLYGRDEVGIEDVAGKWLAEFELTHRVFDSQVRLSRGERTKLWLTTLFTLRPQLWLLDEPHQCGLDARGIAILEEQIQEHRKTGGITVFSSQWPPHARRIADRVILLDKCRMAYEGRVDAISESYDSRDPNMIAILRLLELESAGSRV